MDLPVPIQLQEDTQGHRQHPSQTDQPLQLRHLTAGHGPQLCPLHLPVKVLVPHVINDAPRPPHEKRARSEQAQQPEAWEAACGCGQGDTPGTGPIQQPGTYGARIDTNIVTDKISSITVFEVVLKL